MPASLCRACLRVLPSGAARRSFSSSSLLQSPVTLAHDLHLPKVEREGAGPLVILHGLYGSKQNWRSLAKALSTKVGRKVYALDLRNHGSSPHAEGTTYVDLAGDVIKFIEDNGLKDVVLTGHSMGGKVAMALALKPHESITKLVVADIAPGVGKISPEFRAYLEAMIQIEKAQVTNRKDADAILTETEPDLGVRQFLLTNLERADASSPYKFKIPLSILSAAIDDIGDFPYSPENNKWEGPALFIKGAKSKYINRRNLPQIEQFFPNYKLETLDAGHWVHAEQPKKFLDLMDAFCK